MPETQHTAKSHPAPTTTKKPQPAELRPAAANAPLTLQQGLDNPGAAQPQTILALQRQYGNRAVQRLIQTKLTVGPAGDRYEQEADRVADQVMTQPAVQRQVEEEEVQTKPLAGSITPLVQRQAEEEEEVQTKLLAGTITPLVQRQGEEEEVQTKAQNLREGFEAGSDIEDQLRAQKGSGSPLPGEVRATLEPRFGADFSGVRVHTGGEASQLNRQLSAQAFTHGQDIYMGEGKYDPGSTGGQKLLAHELTHVVQQTGARVSKKGDAQVDLKIQRILDIQDTQWSETEEVIWIKGRVERREGGGGLVTNPVLRFKSGGTSLWVKLGESVPQAQAAAELVQAGGAANQPNRAARGTWNISAPTVRAATAADRAAMANLVGRVFTKLRPASGDQKISRQEKNELAQRILVEPEIQIATHAGGEAGGSAEREEYHPESIAAWNDAGFRRTLGYTTILDLMLGNFDRTATFLAPQNWKVQGGDTLHLIDNVNPGAFDEPFPAWSQNPKVLAARARNWPAMTASIMGTWDLSRSIWDNMPAPEKAAFLASMAQGMAFAMQDLPAIRQRLGGNAAQGDKAMIIQRLDFLRGWQAAVPQGAVPQAVAPQGHQWQPGVVPPH